jgi:hypothetical protein
MGETGATGPTGETGATGPGLPEATIYGQYLYYNGTTWAVGGDKISIGNFAGNTNQGVSTVAVGSGAGSIDQSGDSVAVGNNAGYHGQLDSAVAVGVGAGYTGQKSYAVAVGRDAGNVNQGTHSIAIGYLAGETNQAPNSIVLNANAVALDAATTGLFVAPIQDNTTGTTGHLRYNPASAEITYDTRSIAYNPAVTQLDMSGEGITAVSDIYFANGAALSGVAGSGTTIQVIGDILPTTTDIYSLGSSEQRWADIWLTGQSAHIGESSNTWEIGTTGTGATTYDIYATRAGTSEIYSLTRSLPVSAFSEIIGATLQDGVTFDPVSTNLTITVPNSAMIVQAHLDINNISNINDISMNTWVDISGIGTTYYHESTKTNISKIAKNTSRVSIVFDRVSGLMPDTYNVKVYSLAAGDDLSLSHGHLLVQGNMF